MGQITIEIPQELNRTYRFVSKDLAKKVLSNLERMALQENSIDDNEILGLWSDREDSVEEIARNLRRKTNDRSLKDD